MKNWFRDHGLLLALSALFIASICGQFITGYQSHNDELEKHRQPPLSMRAYTTSGHFIEATFENWESEFLQMGLYVVLTAALYQRGSAESNPLPDELKDEPKDEEKFPKRYFKHNRFARRLYENSLSLVLFVLFAMSFGLHLYGGWREENLKRMISPEHAPPQSLAAFLGSSDFWFQSFQNWQSEFLSVAALVWLSIYLRQKGSAQSKPVDAPHHKTA
jgi:hypothetical protein